MMNGLSVGVITCVIIRSEVLVVEDKNKYDLQAMVSSSMSRCPVLSSHNPRIA